MKIGIIGLGKMGEAIAYKLLQGKHEVVGFDSDKKVRDNVQKIGIKIVDNIEVIPELVRVFWIMVPAGALVDDIIKTFLPMLQSGDIIIDGGNSHFSDSQILAKNLFANKVHYIY